MMAGKQVKAKARLIIDRHAYRSSHIKATKVSQNNPQCLRNSPMGRWCMRNRLRIVSNAGSWNHAGA